MKKILIFFLIFTCFLMINLWGDINSYNHELVKTFPIGSGNGEIGFNIVVIKINR